MAETHAPAGRLIKRYENRKLYDTETRRYVTLDDVARLVAAGHDVRVADQKSGEDLTALMLAQAIFEGIKQGTTQVPLQVLTRLIRLGFGAARKAGEQIGEPARRARDEAERIVTGLLQRGRLPLEEALALRQEIAQSLSKTVAQTQRTLEARFHELLERSERESGVSPAIQSLKQRLLTLEAYLGEAPSGREPRGGPKPRSGRKPRKP
jgi:polyhydroxyalkanoate synthesis repressor PhaR